MRLFRAFPVLTASGNRSRANPDPLFCARCGVPIARVSRRMYCGPCASIRHDETVRANRAKYKAARAAWRATAKEAHRE